MRSVGVHAKAVIGIIGEDVDVDVVADVVVVARGKARCASMARGPACLSLSLFCGYREEEEEVGPGVGLAFERRTRIAAGEAFLYLLPFFHGCMDDGGDVDVDGLHMEGREGCLSHGFREVVAGVVVVVLSKNTVSCCALSLPLLCLSLSFSPLPLLFLSSLLPFSPFLSLSPSLRAFTI